VHVAAGSVLIMQVHYHLSHATSHGGGTPASDLTQVGLQLSPEPVARPASLYTLVDQRFSIPAGASGYSHHATQAVPPGTIWGVLPHMHSRGRRIQVELGGDSLIEIPAWNFHWQQMYFYKKPISVPFFSQLKLTCTWDNPSARTVTWGEGTDDEMCLAYLYLTK
jgi:hypothetical protein